MVYTLVCHLYTLPDAVSISKVKNKLIEASRVYRKDKETVDWHVMQDVHDERKFTIVERFAQESVRMEIRSHAPFPRFLTRTSAEPSLSSWEPVLEDI